MVRERIAIAEEGHYGGFGSDGGIGAGGVPITRAWGTVGIIEDELATTEKRLRGLFAIQAHWWLASRHRIHSVLELQ